jgi:hypothetical protein
MVSRTQPKINLRRLIIKDGDAEAKGMVVHAERFSVSGNALSIKAGEYKTTLFIKPVITLVWLNVFHLLFSLQRVFPFIIVIISPSFRVCFCLFLFFSLFLFSCYLLFRVSGDGMIVCKLELCK